MCRIIFFTVVKLLLNLLTFVEEKIKCTKSWLKDVYCNELQDDNMLRLTVGALMVEKLRQSIFTKTGFQCSAGIANNKVK